MQDSTTATTMLRRLLQRLKDNSQLHFTYTLLSFTGITFARNYSIPRVLHNPSQSFQWRSGTVYSRFMSISNLETSQFRDHHVSTVKWKYSRGSASGRRRSCGTRHQNIELRLSFLGQLIYQPIFATKTQHHA